MTTATLPTLGDIEPTNPTPRVVGLDLSITATGVASWDGSTWTIPTGDKGGDRRLVAIRNEVRRVVDRNAVHLVVIEDLPTHAKAAGITGMVHGAVRTYLLEAGIPFALIVPSSLKKYATGSGNAGKPAMAVAAFKRGGIEPGDDNQVDAWWLRVMGLDQIGVPPFPMPAVSRATLAAGKWPAVAQ